MLTREICSEYRRLRALGFRASEALRAARIEAAFAAAEADGLVTLQVVPDQEPYDASYVDTWGLTAARAERERRALLERADRDGVWGIRVEYTAPCGHTETTGGVWGFLGEDFRDSGYDHDEKLAALQAVGRWAS